MPRLPPSRREAPGVRCPDLDWSCYFLPRKFMMPILRQIVARFCASRKSGRGRRPSSAIAPVWRIARALPIFPEHLGMAPPTWDHHMGVPPLLGPEPCPLIASAEELIDDRIR